MNNAAKPNAVTRIAGAALPTLIATAVLSMLAGLALLVWSGIVGSWPGVTAGFLAEVVGGSWIWKLGRMFQAGATSSNLVERLASAIAERNAPAN